MKQEVVLWPGAGQIGMAIARRLGHAKKIVVATRKRKTQERLKVYIHFAHNKIATKNLSQI